MALISPKALSNELSKNYYHYGKAVASRTYLLLFLSLSFISYFSYPILLKARYNTSSIPLPYLDGQSWQASPHIQISNFTVLRHPPTNYLIIQQIRLSYPDQPVDLDLFNKALQLYETIGSTVVSVDRLPPASLATICFKHQGDCLVQRPPDNIDDLTAPTLPYFHHPLSTMANISYNPQGQINKADGVILTYILNHDHDTPTLRIWNAILSEVKLKLNILDIQLSLSSTDSHPAIWYTLSDIVPHMIHYKYKLFPYYLSSNVQLSIVVYIAILYWVSNAFGKSNLVRSGLTFGLAAVFLSIACFTTTWGILDKLGISLHSVPWYLLLLAVNVSSLENILLLTTAILSAGCDMIVKEKISRGLQSAGVPMTATLIAELLILSVGTTMDVQLIKEFCMFVQLALLVDFILEMTFVIAILSIDIKRVELTDLDDRQVSKRLHELSSRDVVTLQSQPDFCPIQDTPNKQDAKSCADCKDFKTHRVYNALLLCFILLLLSIFCKKDKSTRSSVQTYPYQPELHQLSEQFWSTVRPEKEISWMVVQPPHLMIIPTTTSLPSESFINSHIKTIQSHYEAKTMAMKNQYGSERRPSLFRYYVFSTIQSAFEVLLNINVPIVVLCLVMIGIIVWMTPTWRDQWLLPMLKKVFDQSIIIVSRILNFSHKGIHNKQGEYDSDGVHHRGALAVQKSFNQQQYRTNVKRVQIHTLMNQHTADIQHLDANSKHSLVSCGQEGRIVLWDTSKAKWVARLDKLYQSTEGGPMQSSMNTELTKNSIDPSKKHSKRQLVSTPSRPRCVKVDRSNKWVAAGYDNGLIRVWNSKSGILVREMDIHSHSIEVQEETHGLRQRNKSTRTTSSTRSNDRIIAMEFLGIINEYCHPLVAEVAARCNTSNKDVSHNYLVTVHKSGLMREWDILSGECIQTINTGHTREISLLHVVCAKAPHRKLGITWVFTASKDGIVQCWERQFIQPSSASTQHEDDLHITAQWSKVYSIQHDSPVTSLATELPVGGMGVLITGTMDGGVRVWNFESGESICTLSHGRKETNPENDIMIGGPIKRFSKLPVIKDVTTDISEDEGVNILSKDISLADHQGAIQQVTVTRYCEVENGPGLCRGCDTCFGNGFLIASSAIDNKVHAWRLERSDNGHEGSCTLCTKDYHRKQYKHRKVSAVEEVDSPLQSVASRRRRRPSAQTSVNNGGKKIIRHHVKPSIRPKLSPSSDSLVELLDIEQLGGDVHIPLMPTFLGKIDQPGGNGIVFCDKILAGVRQSPKEDGSSDWETWFASLQYYDPTVENNIRIPIETFSLTHSDNGSNEEEIIVGDELPSSAQSKYSFFGLFGPKVDMKATRLNVKKIHTDHLKEDLEEEEDVTDRMDASENLPFSAIHHIIQLDGCGLACDFGNFIKLVHLDKPSLTEKERIKNSQGDSIVEEIDVTEEIEAKCGDGCSPDNKGKNGCCGGANKEKNGGQCCGGSKKAKKVSNPPPVLGCGVKSIAECSLKYNCSRASDCASSVSRISSSSPWL